MRVAARRCTSQRAARAYEDALDASRLQAQALRGELEAVRAGRSAGRLSRAGAAGAGKPFNPLNLKGQFWETGNMVYVKPTRDPDAAGGLLTARPCKRAARLAAASLQFALLAMCVNNTRVPLPLLIQISFQAARVLISCRPLC